MTGPRVLHLFANYKWTGPADPAIRSAYHLRRHGMDVRFGRAGWTLPGAEHRMDLELWRSRIPVVAGLELRKHFRAFSVWRDARELARRLRADRYDLVHTHLLADHLIAALACRRLRARTGAAPALVRSLYDPDAPRRRWRDSLAFRFTQGAVVPTAAVGTQLQQRFGLLAERLLVQDPPVDPPPGDDGFRLRLELEPDDLVVGITARIQPHRRFDLLWEAARRVVDAEPRARFVLLGRGNEHDTRQLVEVPIRRLGLTGSVRLPGYLHPPEYGSALRALDLFLFLVPGSDGTCRAVREAMALGLPVVATGRGMLPSLLAADPVAAMEAPAAGAICQEEPDALAAAVLTLLGDRSLRNCRKGCLRSRSYPYGSVSGGPPAGRLLRRDPEASAGTDILTRSHADRRQLDLWWRACLAQGGGLPPGIEPVQTRLLRSVGRGELPDSGPVFLKVMGFPRAKDRLRYLFRALPAAHEARLLERLRTVGVTTPEVVTARGARRLGLPRLSLLVTAALPDPGPAPTFADLARTAAAVAAAGVFHPDLNPGNFHPLPDGGIAVLDLQSARARLVGPDQQLAMAAKLWIEHGAAPEHLADLEAAGLVAADRLEALRELGVRMQTRFLVGRIRRCLKTSTGFAVRRRWNGVVYSRRGTWPRGRWIQGGRELLKCWIGDRTLEVLDGVAPRIHALFRKSWWFPGQHSVYIASADTDEAVFRARMPGYLEGYWRYGRLRNGKPYVNTTCLIEAGASTGRA